MTLMRLLPAVAVLLAGLCLPSAAASDLLGSGARTSTLLGGPTITSAVGPPLPEAEAFRVDVVATGPQRLLLRFQIAEGYYVYRDKLRVRLLQPAEANVQVLSWPAAKVHNDPYFGEQAVYSDELTLPLAIGNSDGARRVGLQVDFMACQDGGICYPPLRRRFEVELPAASGAGR